MLAPHGDGPRKDGLKEACLTLTWLARHGQRASLPNGKKNKERNTIYTWRNSPISLSSFPLRPHYSSSFIYSVQKTETSIFLLFYFRNKTLYGTVLQHDNARPNAARHNHTVPRQKQRPNARLAFHVPRLKPRQKHLERVGEMCSRQRERPDKCTWVVSETKAGVVGHPSPSDSQPDPVHAYEMLGSYWFSRRTHPVLMCVSFSRKIPSDWTFSWTRRVLKSWTLTWINCKMKYNELDF